MDPEDPSWAQVGAGCINQMKLAQAQISVKGCILVQAETGCCILLLLDPLQRAQ